MRKRDLHPHLAFRKYSIPLCVKAYDEDDRETYTLTKARRREHNGKKCLVLVYQVKPLEEKII